MKALREFWEAGHPESEKALREWYRTCEGASWSTFADLKRDFRSADLVGDRVIFNILNNRYRLIAIVNFVRHGVLVRWIGSHPEYDRLTEGEIRNL
jgi:mRNA interferase HigB